MLFVLYQIGQYKEGKENTFLLARSRDPNGIPDTGSFGLSWPEFAGYVRALAKELPKDIFDIRFRNGISDSARDLFPLGKKVVSQVSPKYLDFLIRNYGLRID